jgi:TRAP-type mannitol/chloroaromatic compound transport system permease large subunit
MLMVVTSALPISALILFVPGSIIAGWAAPTEASAMAAFYLKGVSPPSVLLSEIYWGMMPFMMLQLTGLLIVYFFPELTTWLPKLVFGG